MRYSENSSWEFRIGVPEDLNFAVAVLSVLNLGTSELPALLAARSDEPIPELPTLHVDDHDRIAQHWAQWWAEMTESRSDDQRRRSSRVDPPDFDMLKSSPRLREACRLAWSPFLNWWGGVEGRKHRLETAIRELGGVVGQLVADHEHREGRTCRPFLLSVDVLAVDSMDTVLDDHAYAQIGSLLLTDPMAFASWFRSILRKIG